MEAPNLETNKEAILGKINQKLAALGSKSEWLRSPEFFPEYEMLKGKTILMVDDIKEVIEGFVPDLMVATNGNASFIQHGQQTIEELVDEIMKANPNIVLLDYNLAQDIKGDVVARLLKEKGFAGESIGFSSENEHAGKFMKAGALGCIEKSTFEPSDSIKKLAEIV